MFYAFNINDTKYIDTFNINNINKVKLIAFGSIDKLEDFIDKNYNYIGLYDYKNIYTTPINFKNKNEAYTKLIECLNH